VYDRLNNDAHSYWVGASLANGAFVQVGYLNGLSTTGQFYCCAWFYEYFPPGNNNSPPFIGLEGSAGPIGSWHTYSMISTGNGGWSFYMDNNYLGSSPQSGTLYLGAGAVNTGNHPVAGIAEVAQTTNDRDIIGPAEFRNIQFETTIGSWQQVPTGKVHIGFGATSSQSLANPYSVVEVEGVPDDFLAGSNIPKPGSSTGSDPCGTSADSNTLWTPSLSTCPTNTSFAFSDEEGASITPSWFSLRDNSNLQIFYTEYAGQRLPNPSFGPWNVTQVSWHSVNVATSYSLPSSSTTSFTIPTKVFSIHVSVLGAFYSLPITNANITAYLPDSTSQIVTTDSSGQGLLTQLPPSNYLLHITVPNGLASNTNRLLDSPGTVTARVFGLPELLTITILPILGAIIIVTVIVQKETKMRALMRATAPTPVLTPITHCTTCGQALLPNASFCQNCGTPVANMRTPSIV
jgi:hypothetical protein